MRYNLYIFAFFISIHVHAQLKPVLQSWHTEESGPSIHHEYLQNRISNIYVKDSVLFITIDFKPHSTSVFNPVITYAHDTLYVNPLGEGTGTTPCNAHKYYSLELVITGIPDTSFCTSLSTEVIHYSTSPYRTYPIHYEIKDGDTINRTSIYGARVGVWKTYYEKGRIHTETFYPYSDSPRTGNYTWEKAYYPNGQMSYHHWPDSSESWYENGKLRHMEYQSHPNGDSRKEKTVYYNSGVLQEHSVVRFYRKENQFIDPVTGLNTYFRTEEKETYYENGRAEYMLGDTSKWWFENGDLKKWGTADTAVGFDLQGNVCMTEKTWYVTDTSITPKLKHTVTKLYYPNGNLRRLTLVRGELHGSVFNAYNRYEWEWDAEGILTGRPSLWQGPIPK